MTSNQHPSVMAFRIAKIIYDCDLLLASDNLDIDDRVRTLTTRAKWMHEAKLKGLETKVVLHCTYEVLGLRLN